FDLDLVKAGAGSGSPALVITNEAAYFRNKRVKNSRIYPTRFSKKTIPTISACAEEILRKEPEARARALDAWIDLAVSAHGVGNATLRANQAFAGQPRTSKPSKKSGTGEGDASGPAAKKPPGAGQSGGELDTGSASS